MNSLQTQDFISGLSATESKKHIFINAETSGVSPENVEVSFKDGVLSIIGEGEEFEENEAGYRDSLNAFFYKIVPDGVDPEKQPKISFRDGLLRVSFDKSLKY